MFPVLGNMYMFQYDPAGKDTLPYWDRFPLIFPFDDVKRTGRAIREGGFMGINFHYLPPRLRARLMDALYTRVIGEGDDQHLVVTYQILKSASRFRFFKPAVKRYSMRQMRSKFFLIEPDEWDIALMLPTQRFVKAPKSRVYKESIARI